MISLSARVGAWLLQASTALPDTIYTKQIEAQPSWFDTVSSIASSVMSITMLVLAVALVPAAWNFRNSYRRINKLLDQVYGDINPLMRHASSIADNVDYITTSIRVDVQQVNRTIAAANQRLQQAMALTEQRLNEFNALIDVVQREAEGMFVASAATVHGVRAGAARLRDELAGEMAPGDETEDVAYLEEAIDADEVTHGIDSGIRPEDRQPRPRIRRRPRAQPE